MLKDSGRPLGDYRMTLEKIAQATFSWAEVHDAGTLSSHACREVNDATFVVPVCSLLQVETPVDYRKGLSGLRLHLVVHELRRCTHPMILLFQCPLLNVHA